MAEITLDLALSIYHSEGIILAQQESIKLDRAIFATNKTLPAQHLEASLNAYNYMSDNKIKGICIEEAIGFINDEVIQTGSKYNIFNLPFYMPNEQDCIALLNPTESIEFNTNVEDEFYILDAFNLKKENDSWNYYNKFNTENGLLVSGAEVSLDVQMDDIYKLEYLFLGYAEGSNKTFQIPYRPIAEINVYYFNGVDYIEIAVSNILPDQDDTTLTCVVDYWRGLIHLSGETYPSSYLKEAVTLDDEIIVLYPTDDVFKLPLQGYITIDSETIYYHARHYNKLYCLREAPAVHAVGAEVIKQTGTTVTDGLGIYCRPKLGLYLRGYNPTRSKESLFVNKEGMFISTLNERILSSLSLSINAESKLAYRKFGYLEIGNGTKQNVLKCIAYDGFNQTLRDYKIEFRVDTPALLSPYSSQITKITDVNGQALTPIYFPYVDPFGQNIVSISYDGSDTLIEVANNLAYCELTDILLYQVVKFDPLAGTKGIKQNIISISSTLLYGMSTEIEVSNVPKEIKGILYYIDGSTLYSISIDKIVGKKLYSTEIPASYTFTDAWLLYEDDAIWDSSLLLGTKLLIAYYDTYYKALRPSAIEGRFLRYTNVSLALPDPDDMMNNIGAYFVVTPTEISARAFGTNIYNEEIQSNTLDIVVKLDINMYTSSDVDAGLKLYETVENTSAISEGNYLTLNPTAPLYSFSIKTLPT